MKKRIVALLLVVSALSMLGGCKKVECELCGDEEYCKNYEIDGEKYKLCEDCIEDMEELKELGESFKNLFD